VLWHAKSHSDGMTSFKALDDKNQVAWVYMFDLNLCLSRIAC